MASTILDNQITGALVKAGYSEKNFHINIGGEVVLHDPDKEEALAMVRVLNHSSMMPFDRKAHYDSKDNRIVFPRRAEKELTKQQRSEAIQKTANVSDNYKNIIGTIFKMTEAANEFCHMKEYKESIFLLHSIWRLCKQHGIHIPNEALTLGRDMEHMFGVDFLNHVDRGLKGLTQVIEDAILRVK